jgi:hypothetical protein
MITYGTHAAALGGMDYTGGKMEYKTPDLDLAHNGH